MHNTPFLGRVAEWPNASVSKADSLAIATGVQIPPHSDSLPFSEGGGD